MSERMKGHFPSSTVNPRNPYFCNMGNVPPTHVFIESLCGAGHEIGFPEDAPMKPPRGFWYLLGGLSLGFG